MERFWYSSGTHLLPFDGSVVPVEGNAPLLPPPGTVMMWLEVGAAPIEATDDWFANSEAGDAVDALLTTRAGHTDDAPAPALYVATALAETRADALRPLWALGRWIGAVTRAEYERRELGGAVHQFHAASVPRSGHPWLDARMTLDAVEAALGHRRMLHLVVAAAADDMGALGVGSALPPVE